MILPWGNGHRIILVILPMVVYSSSPLGQTVFQVVKNASRRIISILQAAWEAAFLYRCHIFRPAFCRSESRRDKPSRGLMRFALPRTSALARILGSIIHYQNPLIRILGSIIRYQNPSARALGSIIHYQNPLGGIRPLCSILHRKRISSNHERRKKWL